MDKKNKLEQGYINQRKVLGNAHSSIDDSVKDIFPDLEKYMVEYVWGELYNREALDLKSREIAAVAALTALGNAQPQLRLHMNGALNVGCTINEIKEIILQMSAFSGFPSCINAVNLLIAVLDERKSEGIEDDIGTEPTNEILPETRYEIGSRVLSELDGRQVELLEKFYGDFSPELVELIVCGQADITARNNIDKRYRELASISAMTALGTAQSQLKTHINMALNIGVTSAQLKELMLLMTAFSGFPSAVNGMNSLMAVLADRK
ncbi:4-carboxymuconolactone decarboxylase [Ruminiclostridium sufflavum DSM 19573]|uniref:4-carboxymuconolactone decarboxylase n=1 Tax=Ruminiclostridium sufflavum DSM 19573 TaxID=1121337 RepID=A0A318XL10_9FIRM|nr:carboxymuconolactone decarboxylase family protein [Ruminiclostridium sufflavum]PYG88213.1 4-carboxymuconolactone decarboxylase [Ruminiclostridium sufflavum DSM 19573]